MRNDQTIYDNVAAQWWSDESAGCVRSKTSCPLAFDGWISSLIGPAAMSLI
jgi:hypothetical protein